MSTHNESTIGSSTPPRGGTPNLNDSPTTTFSQSSSIRTPSSNIRLDASRPYRNIFASNTSTPTRQAVVRSDPSLLTCFDPADKELYDLWAPKI
ncbi:hypothetical protein DFP72DRAFT_1061530 [Ephemerocybe angulata]|uniref:Uncharacterized protein n=1 Tax=Ephemerocybe angulata TaxID=980116 RepID=A0A8H6IBW6_9AGAR|nr:hypothetical protein DFP72DRAFT_1061530 [Tulosesus angulatus]